MNLFPTGLTTDSSFKIICTTDIAQPNTKDFLNALQTTQTSLDTISKEQQKIAANLQARNAPPEKIDLRYTNWTEQLLKLSSEISGCRSKIEGLLEKLPFIDDMSVCKEAFQTLNSLSQRSYRLEKANKKLNSFSNSPELRKTLELCKEIIQKCEKETNASNVPLDAVITEVQEQITETHDDLKNLKADLRSSIMAIHQDTLRFLAYVAKEAHASDAQERITNLLKKVSASDTELASKELTGREEQTLNNSKDIDLPNNRYFRNGIYGANWRYPTIYPIVEKMQNSAKGLQDLEKDIEGKIQSAWQGMATQKGSLTEQEWQEHIQSFKTIITKQREQLYDISFCNEVHSGLHYAASLFTWIDDLQDNITFLLKTASDSWLKVGELQKLFAKQLNPPTKYEMSYAYKDWEYIKTINELIRTLHSISQLDGEKPFFTAHKNQIQKAVTTSLSRMSSSIFEFSSYEEKAEKEILLKTPFSCDIQYVAMEKHPQQKSLLSKRVIHCLHFTNDPFDISLDLLLTMLETQPIYVSYFNKLLHMDEHCKQLVTRYKLETAMDIDKELLKELSELCHLLKTALEPNKNDTKEQELSHFFAYCRYLQKITDLKRANHSPQGQKRLQSFIQHTNHLAKELKAKYKSPNYSYTLSKITLDSSAEVTEPILYTLLLQALWSLDPESQLQARNRIESIIDKPQLNFMNDDIKSLLKALALQSFLDLTHTDISKLQKIYLPQLILERLKDPSYGLSIFSMGAMETALYHLLHGEGSIQKLAEDPLLAKALEAFRNGTFYSTWEKTMETYSTFKNTTENKPLKYDSNEHKSRLEYLKTLRDAYKDSNLNTPEFKRDRYVLKTLYQEMKNMIITER